MPAVAPNTDALVLVTGANGYIAAHVVRELLEKGYRVRGTVRRPDAITHLKKTFASHGDKLEFVVVSDITAEGAFDEVVRDVDAIEHVASPVSFTLDDPQDAIVPAVHGTTSLINSVLKHGQQVKRIVITASCASILEVRPEPTTFSEKDWNEESWRIIEEKGRESEGVHKYRASKTLAEKAAWKLWESNRSTVGWDLTTIHPSFVFGPVLHEVSEPSKLNVTALDFWESVVKGTRDAEGLATIGTSWIDVRDLGVAHQLALEKQAAGGERIIISGGTYKWQDFVDAANAIQPPPYPSLPKGVPGAGKAEGVRHMVNYDTTKARKLFGFGGRRPWTTKEQCARDSIADFVSKGWKP